MATKEEILETISNMTVLELSELIKEMEDKFGVSAAAPVAVAAVAAEEEGAAGDAKSDFDVVLSGFDASKKIAVIKLVREITGLGLKEAKDVVEAGGKALKEGVSKEEADELKAKLEEAGATVEIK